MAKCQARDCQLDASRGEKLCYAGLCTNRQTFIVCEAHLTNTFYICPEHTYIGVHPSYTNIIHNKYIRYGTMCECSYHKGERIFLILDNEWTLYIPSHETDTTNVMLRYNNNVFHDNSDPNFMTFKSQQHFAQVIYPFTYKPHLLSWKTRPELYLSAFPTDICNIISLYL